MNRQRTATGSHHLDPRADGRAVGLLAYQFHGQRTVRLAGVLKEDVVVFVAIDGTPHFNKEVHVAIAVPVANADAVSLLQVPDARGSADLGEPFASDVLEHAVGN